MKTNTILFWSGLGIVVSSHYAMLTDSIPPDWEDTFKQWHAPANLTAAGMILVSEIL